MQFMLPKIKIRNRTIHFSIREERAILLGCMGIALVFWLLVKLSQTYQTDKEVHFQFELADDKAFSDMPPEKINAVIEGTGWDLLFDYIKKSRVHLTYNLRNVDRLNLNVGQITGDITRNLATQKVEVVRVDYDDLNLILEDKDFRTVPVILNASITLASDFYLRDSISLTPDSITMAGPGSKIAFVEQWETDSLHLQEVDKSLVISQSLVTPPPELTLSQKSVQVNIEVERFTEKFFFVPISVVNAPDSIKIFPEKIKVRSVVGLSKYEDISAKDFKLEVDLEGISLNTTKNSVPIILKERPEFVRHVTFSPKSAEFFILQGEEQKKEGNEEVQ